MRPVVSLCSLGCNLKRNHDLWTLKYFDFYDFVTSFRAGFIGRQWLYQEMDEIMDKPDGRGVLLIGNPGSGKTAFVCHLLCSRTLSPFIHDRILGYHFCMHSDKGTQNAAKFVRNLANMIASRIDQYREKILNDPFVKRVLQHDCQGDPEWCFQEGIITPLVNLSHQSKQPWYVIIDALDECAVGNADILDMLKSKVQRLPVWFKLIITTRNVSTITKGFKMMQILELQQDDPRNMEDIDLYTWHKIYPLKSELISKIKSYFLIKDNSVPSQRIVSSLVEKSQGNFLFTRLVLDTLLATTESTSWTENIPKTLDNVFQLYFERKFTSNSFQSLREIFEILVASHRPLSAAQIYSVLQLDNPSLDYEYDIIPKLEKLSLFLWHGSGNGFVRIYHASLSEWLTSESNKGRFYYVKKRNGHKRLAQYYLQKVKNFEKRLTPEEAYYLTYHIVEGGSNRDQVRKFLSIPSHVVNGTDEFNTTALHISARLTSSEVTALLIKHFSDVDCLTKEYRTSAFVSAGAGCLKNLIILSTKGANLNYTVKCLDYKLSKNSKDPVRECQRLACEYSLLHIAAQEGNVDIVAFLTERHANVLKTTSCNNTAMQLAATNGHLEVVKALMKAGGVLDGASLHHAAAAGHKSVVDYLLSEGVKDVCIDSSHQIKDPNKSRNRNNNRIQMLDVSHLDMRETALHAAVKMGYSSVIESLLRQHENAVNCINAEGRRPLHEAVHFNNYHALQVMLEVGINTSVRCNASVPNPWVLSGRKPSVLLKNFYPCGFTALHIAAMRGYHSVAELLITHKAEVNVRDCNGSTPLHIAACHGMVTLVNLLVRSGANVDERTFNFSTPLHSAAACFATNSFCTLLELGGNFLAKDENNLTALYYIARNVGVVGKEFFTDLYTDKPINWIDVLSEKEPWRRLKGLQYTWLNALIRTANTLTAVMGVRQFFNLSDPISETYEKVFHLLTRKGKVSSLLTGNSRYHVSSYLIITTSPAVYLYDRMTHNLLKFVDPAFLPDLFKSAIFKTFRTFIPRIQNCSFLNLLIKSNTVLSANMLLKVGGNVNCQDESGKSPLLIYLHNGGRHTSKVLAKHKVKTDISCRITFENSTLHLISYHKLHYLHYLTVFSRGEKEWSKYLASNDSLFDYFLDYYEEFRDHRGLSKVIRTGDGPLALAIKSHPRGIQVIDDCFDAEGYNALHRAAQGANVIALQRFLSWGANPSLKNADGFTPLWISVLYSVKYTPFLNFRQEHILAGLELEIASMAASYILNHLLQSGSVNIGCNESSPDLTLYHLAAIRGMWRFVDHLLSERLLTGVDVNCPNRDGITPMYLAKLVGGDDCTWHSPWCKVVDTIKNFGGTLRYPNLEAEYFLFFHLFFGMSPGNLSLELPEHEITTLQEECERTKCQDYRRGYTNLLKSSWELDFAYNDYRNQVYQCETHLSERCLPEIKRHLNHFQSVLPALFEHQDLKYEHVTVSGHFSGILEIESGLLRSSLLDVTRPYSREQRVKDTNRGKTQTDETHETNKQRAKENNYKKNDEQGWTTSKSSEESKQEERCECRRVSLRSSFLRFKEHVHQLLKLSKQTQSVMFAKGDFSRRVLSRLDRALYNYYTTTYCDWQANTAKYVLFRFQYWNLKFFTRYVNENSRLVSISDFASSRVRKVLTRSSKDLMKLVFKLASKEKFDDLNYLTILKFREPPLWKGTFAKWDFL